MINAHDRTASELLNGLARSDQAPEGRLGQREERGCPVCGQTMTAQEERGATAAVCSQHGVWFDQDQWEQYTASRRPAGPTHVVDAVTSFGTRRPRGYSFPPKADLVEEQYDLGGGD
jgi:hypothetical protein